MLLLAILRIALGLISFMLAPFQAVLPFEVVSILMTFLNYIADGIKFVVFFCFDAWLVRVVFSFIITVNAILLGYDLIWRIITYFKLSRDG